MKKYYLSYVTFVDVYGESEDEARKELADYIKAFAEHCGKTCSGRLENTFDLLSVEDATEEEKAGLMRVEGGA